MSDLTPDIAAVADADRLTEAADTAEPQRSAMIESLRRRRARHEQRPRAFRVAWAVGGFAVLACGLLMLLLPGPAFAVIPAGLAMLALEFSWAERSLVKALVHAEKAKRQAQQATFVQRACVVVVCAACVAGFMVGALRYDIPLLPV